MATTDESVSLLHVSSVVVSQSESGVFSSNSIHHSSVLHPSVGHEKAHL